MITLDKKELAQMSKMKHVEALIGGLTGYDVAEKYGFANVVEEAKHDMLRINYTFDRVSEFQLDVKLNITELLPTGSAHTRKTFEIGTLNLDEDLINIQSEFNKIKANSGPVLMASSLEDGDKEKCIEYNQQCLDMISKSMVRRKKAIDQRANANAVNSIAHIRDEIFNQLSREIQHKMLTNSMIKSTIEGVGQIRGVSIEVSDLKSNNHSSNANYKQYVTVDLEPLRWENDRGEFLRISQLQFYVRMSAREIDEMIKFMKGNPDANGNIGDLDYSIEYKGSNMKTSAQNEKELLEFLKGYRGALSAMAHLRNMKKFVIKFATEVELV